MEGDRMEKPPRMALTIKEAAEAMGISAGHVRNRIKRGDLRTVKIGRRVLITTEALKLWLEGCGVKPDNNPVNL